MEFCLSDVLVLHWKQESVIHWNQVIIYCIMEAYSFLLLIIIWRTLIHNPLDSIIDPFIVWHICLTWRGMHRVFDGVGVFNQWIIDAEKGSLILESHFHWFIDFWHLLTLSYQLCTLESVVCNILPADDLWLRMNEESPLIHIRCKSC